MKKREVYKQFHRSLLALIACVIFASIGVASTPQSNNVQPPQIFRAKDKMVVVVSEPKIPVVISDVRNMEPDWWKDLEVEVENKSYKPIYCIGVDFAFTALLKDEQGRGYGFTLFYGNTELLQLHSRVSSQDIAIEKNQKHIFKLPEPFWKGLEHYIAARGLSLSTVKRIVVKVSDISFGNGTGFISGMEFPAKQS